MARYRIRDEQSSVSIELSEIGGQHEELLEAFGECQSGRCSCPTDQYDKVASMEVQQNSDQITLRLQSKPGTHLGTPELAACLDYTIASVEPRG